MSMSVYNTAANVTVMEQQELYLAWEKAVICGVWLGMSVPAYVMSVLIARVVWRNKRYHSAGYYLMLQLSACDLLTLTFYILFGLPQSLLYPAWTLHINTRSLVGTFKVITYSTGVYIMFLISANRYISVCHYSRYKLIFTTKTLVICVIGSLFLGVGSGILLHLLTRYYWQPAMFGFIVDPHNANTSYVLRLNQAIAVLLLISGGFFYGSVLLKMRKSSKFRAETRTTVACHIVRGGRDISGTCEQQQVARDTRREFVLSMQFMVVTIVFVLAWVGLSVQSDIDVENLTPLARKLLHVTNSTSWIANYSINSFVYIIINKRLRQDVIILMCKKKNAAIAHFTTSVG